MDTPNAGNEKPTVYIETSIVSYLTARPSRDLLVAAHQQLTVVWWDEQRTHYELFTSQVVVAEARAGDPDAAQRRLVVLERLPLLDVTDAAIALATLLIPRAGAPCSSSPRCAPPCSGVCPRDAVSADVELHASGQCAVTESHRTGLS
jgi:hypothetical protein